MVVFCTVLFSCKDKKKDGQTTISNNPLEQPGIRPLTDKIEKDPEDAALYFQRGNALHKAQQDSLALNDYKKAVTLDSTKAQYYSAIGNLLFEHKDIDGSTQWLEKAIQLDPEDETARLKMAKLFIYTRDYNNAFRQINIVLRKNTYNVEGYFLKGIIRKDLADTNAAISSFQTVLQIDPTYRDAAIQLGLLYSGKRDGNAVKYLDNAFKLDTTDVFPLYAKGMFHQKEGNYEAAKKEYTAAIRYDKRYADAYFNTGFILMQQDSLEAAVGQFNKAISAEPAYPAAHYNKGLCYEILGNNGEARKAYQEALTFAPDYADAKEALKRVQ